ncbi:choice-of-anchor L domain-containing protein [Flavobacteriales bacterium]|nr:choice-of-anchor L domain-containing protein [Flavobacteriales bacterium]
MKKNFFILSLLLAPLIFFGQISVNNSPPYNSPQYLVDDILIGANCINTSNITFQGDPMQIGYFSNAISANLNIEDGIIISTGDVNIVDPTFTNFVFQPPNVVSDPDLLNVANDVPPLLPAPFTNSFTVSSINDVAILEFDFVPNSSNFSFDYVFGSLEYFEFENTEFNDVFGFFISGPGINGPYSSPSYHPDGSINLANVPLFSPDLPITVSSINDTTPFNPQYFIDNRLNQSNISEVKGHTTVFTANATLIPGQTYHIRLAIADGSDNYYNSFIWLDGGSFTSSDFSPNVSASISDNTCNSLTDLTINVSQDPNEEDIDYATFSSNSGSFDLVSLSIGDTVGSATINLTVNSNTFDADLIVSNVISSTEVEIQAIDNSNGFMLGDFILKNLPSGGVEIFADSPSDGNNTTGGNSSTVTFNDLFINPNSSYLYFYYNLTSELLCNYSNNQYFSIVNCITFSPSYGVGLSDYNCQATTDLTINVSQDPFEEDIDYATFTSNNGSFDFSSLIVGDIIGVATMNLSLSSFTADIIVSSIISTNEIVVEAIDQLTGANLGDFTLENLSAGGVEIFADSPVDGNFYTSGNNSTITFFNIFQNPSSSSINFNFSVTSELGSTYNNSYTVYIICCPDFSPYVNYSLADLICVTTDLSINVSQDCNEEDISNTIITSNAGSFNISSMNIGDNIGNANLNFSSGSYNANLIVGSVVSSSEIIVDVIDQASGNLLSTFNILNLSTSGIELTSLDLLNDFPGDGDNYTSYLNATINFINVFENPNNSIALNFNTQLTSEIGSYQTTNHNFNITCVPSLNLFFSYPSCFGYNDASFDLNGFGGTGSYNYQLQVFDTLLSLWIPVGQSPLAGNYTTNTVSFINLFAGCYKIITTDNAGNISEENICLYEPDLIIAYELITNVTAGLNNDGSIEIINSIGGIRPFTYSWTGPNGFTAITENIFNLEAGTYYLTITDGNGCSETFVYVLELLISGCMDSIANNYDPSATFDDGSCCYLNFYDDNIVLCLGDSVELLYSNLGSNADSYLWSTGDVTPFLFVNPIVDSSYYLDITYNGNVCSDSITVTISCLEFSPTVSVSLSNLNCSLTDLTIDVAQDPNEIDMDSAVFVSDAGSFIISTMSVGDNIGFANMNIGFVNINADLIVSSIISSSKIEVEAINQISGSVLGMFSIENLTPDGVKIISSSPGDGNNYTLNGNSSSITFVNVFDSPDTGFLNFTSLIDSELGNNDIQYFPFILNCTDFSPSVNVSLSSYNCEYLTDLTISVSQDPFEVDMDTATFISDGGFFLLSSLSVGDNIGLAAMTLNLSSFNTNLIVNSIVSSNEIVVEAIDQITAAVLGTFSIRNILGGGIEIIAVSPDDGNLYTNGNISSITFINLFQTPNTSTLTFSSSIISELGDVAVETNPFLLNCQISPTVSVLLSDLNCGLTDLTIVVSQDSNEVDIDTAFFISDGGFFTISSMTIGDNIGFADMALSSVTYNADLVINNIVSANEIIVEAIDQITGAVLGTFTIINLPTGGVEIIAVSPNDGNSFTSGHISSITFVNVFQSPLTGFLDFTSIIISEIGDVDTQVFSFILNCTDFTPNVSISLSDLNCGVLADLTISVSQDSNEVDMDTAIFISNGGSFTISSMSLGDNIGSASMVLYLDSYTADLIVSNIVSPNEVVVEAVDQVTGLLLGTFIIKNLIGGGIEIIAVSPGDSNFSTNGNSSVVTFNNVFTTSSSGLLTFTSSITSELGQLDTQSSSFAIGTISSYFTIFRCDEYTWNGNTFDTTGIYVDTMSSIIGCDSIVTLNLTIYNSSVSFDTISACDNYFWNGVSYDSSGNYIDTIINSVGCDSIMYLNLTLNSNFSNNIITACDNYLFNGVVYDSTGIYIDTLINSFGCDSIVTIDLTINYTNSNIDTVIACDSYVWNGVTYDTSGIYYIGGSSNNYSMNFDGLDDYVNLNSNPSFAPTTSSDFTISIWVNPTISHEGMIVSQYENIVPTNSNYFLAINSNNTFRVAGDGTNFYDFGSASIGSWQYVSLVFHSTGSVDTYINGVFTGSSALNLLSSVSSMPLEVGDIFTGGCVGCIEPFNGLVDNIETWDIALSSTEIQDNMICSPVGNENNLIGYWNFEEGLGITVNDLTIYNNDGIVNGSVYNADAPNQSCSLTNINGCDSISILDLTINYSSEVFDTIVSCDSLFWNGIVYDTSGTYSDTLLNIYGCDSIVNINLTINYSNSSVDSITSCDSLLWNGVMYFSSGIYDTLLVNVSGCDSFVQLYLTIIPTIYNTIFDQACGNYLFNGSSLDSSGIYYDTLSAINGCDSIIILDLIISPNITAYPIITQVACYGDSTGEIDLNIASGSSPYIIQWSNGGSAQQIFNLFGDSLYTCNIVDSAGCSLDTNVYLSQPSILNVSESITNVSCFDGNDGSISLSVFGGTTPYSVDWGVFDTLNLVSNYYSYLVSDSNGCVVFDSIFITQPNPITISVVTQNIQCFGQATGAIEINVSTGSGVPAYTYEWIGPTLFSSTNDDIFNLFAGDYNLTITDANSCEFDTIITLTEPVNLPQFTNIQISDYSGFNIGCKGDNSGWVSVQVTGGYEPYSYLWSNFSTSDSIYNLSVGTYTLEVTDSLGCIIVFDFPLIEPAEVLSTNILATTDYNGYNISCYGFKDAALLGIASGGVPVYTYFWNSIASNDSIYNLEVGNYELIVYDNNNCVSSSIITLIQPDSLYMDLFTFTDTCSKGVGRAEANVYGGVNPYSYNWSNGDSSSVISNFSKGSYTITVTDDNLCQIFDSITISNLPSPIIDFGILPDNQRLFDQLDDPIVFVDYTNGIWQDIVQWIWDYDNGSFGSDSISYHSFSDTGTYIIMLTTVSEYNCIDTLTKLLTITDYNLYIPNAFTPFSTNDELNEVFKAYGIGITDFKMEIYDRWGGRLFTSTSLDVGWDGTTKNGNQVPVGIYIYLIEAVNIYGENFKYHGQVKLIR